jgi:hypothetical protein
MTKKLNFAENVERKGGVGLYMIQKTGLLNVSHKKTFSFWHLYCRKLQITVKYLTVKLYIKHLKVS